jgi:2-polyprenyl-3-methyl-5-hydroxy-6-metoxy-1,4-benzoquinol methylase
MADCKENSEAVIAGNVYDKYNTRNLIARLLMDQFIRTVAELVDSTGVSEIHDVGCGEGRLAALLATRGYRVRGSDLSPAIIEIAKKEASLAGLDISFKASGIEELTEAEDSADLILGCEILEHLDDPEGALRVLALLASPYLLVSVPKEPLWRALNLLRGKYWRSFGNTPGHVQHWSRDAFQKFLARKTDILAVRSPLPWTVALCRNPRAKPG